MNNDDLKSRLDPKDEEDIAELKRRLEREDKEYKERSDKRLPDFTSGIESEIKRLEIEKEQALATLKRHQAESQEQHDRLVAAAIASFNEKVAQLYRKK